VRSAPAIAHGTGTRGAGTVAAAILLAVALCAGAAIVTSSEPVRRARVPPRLGGSLAVAAAIVLVIAVVAYGPPAVQTAWRQFHRPVVVTTSDPASRLWQLSGTRYDVWRTALSAFAARPLTGTGAGTYEFWWDRHPSTPEFVRDAHSLELQNMAELGAPGLVLILVLMAAAAAVLVEARRRSRRSASVAASGALLGAFAVYLVQASVDWMWESTAVTALALAGAAVAGARLSGARPGVRWYGRAVAVVVAAAAVAIQVPGLLSTTNIRRSQAAERAGNAAAALSLANAAVAAEPWAASPYEQRGLVLEATGRLGTAAEDLGRAIAREPTNFRHWLLLARIEAERGRVDAALEDYARARRLRPRAQVFETAPEVTTGP
jgi:hypothetical protein